MHRLPISSRVLAAACVAYGFGLFGLLCVGWPLLFGGGLPSLTWWQWLLAPLAFAVLSFCGEWLTERGRTVGRRMADGPHGNGWRNFAAVAVIAILLLASGSILYVSRAH